MRLVLALVLAGAAMLGAAWLADRPGNVAIEWEGWRVDTTAGALLLGALALAVASAALYRLWRALVAAPQALAGRRQERRRRKGYEALTQGLIAIAAGDASEARRQAGRADRYLADPPLTALLSAQAAQLSGDDGAARAQFTAMLARPETEFVGLRGLLLQAVKGGDRAQALELARRAVRLKPRAPWLLTTLFELQTRAGAWEEAAETLGEARRAGAVAEDAALRGEAALRIELSRARLDRPREALRQAEAARRADPDHPAASSWLARRYVAAGRTREARRVVEEEWPRRPHPDLIEAYREACEAKDPLVWLRTLDRLFEGAPSSRAALAAMGAAALEAKLWGEARRHAAAAIAADPAPAPAGLCRLMARIEEAEMLDDGGAARAWLARAAEAPPDPVWLCDACGKAHDAWQATCARCGAFDRIVWRAPERALALPLQASSPALPVPARTGPPAVPG